MIFCQIKNMYSNQNNKIQFFVVPLFPMYKLYILLAALLTLCMFGDLHSRTNDGFIRYTIPKATISSPNFISSNYVTARPNNFSLSYILSQFIGPRIFAKQEKLISENDMSKLKQERIQLSIIVSSCLLTGFEHLFSSDDILGG